MSDDRGYTSPLPPEQPVTVVNEASPPPSPPRRRLGPVWWGVALIAIGAALLVGQFVPGLQAWRFWPLIIVALGVRQIFGPSGRRWTVRYLGDGLTTITLGLILLGQMTGYLAWNVWLNVLRLWPLLLVSLGLEIIGKAVRIELLRLLGSLVVVAGLAYAALVMSPSSAGPFGFVQPGESQEFSESARNEEDVEEGKARIEGGVGQLSVTAGSELVTAEGITPFDPVFEVEQANRSADVRVSLGEGAWWPAVGETRLDVTLDETVAWDLEIEAGVATYKADLRDLQLRSLDLDAGVSDGTVVLGQPEAERTPVKINAGVSSLTVQVPRGYGVRVRVSAGLTGVDVEGDWTDRRDDDARIYESAEFDEDEPYWDIEINAGVGGVNVEYY